MVRKPTPDKLTINELSPQFAGLRYWWPFLPANAGGDFLYEVANKTATATYGSVDPVDEWIIDSERGFVGILNAADIAEYWEATDPPFISGETDLSISAWVKIDSTTGTKTYFSKTDGDETPFPVGFALGWDTTNGWQFSFEDSGTSGEGHTGKTGYTTDTWYHVVAVYNGNGSTDVAKVKIYVDGQDQSLTFSGTIPSAMTANGSVLIGAYKTAGVIGTEQWVGRLDDIRVYGSILSSGAIANMHNFQTRWELYEGREIGWLVDLALQGGSTFNETGEGGSLVGGATDLSVIFNPANPTSGVILGGLATISTSGAASETGEGGILVGGAITDLSIIFNPELTSGILVGGAIPDLYVIFNPELTSGVILGGTSIVGEEQEETVSGGILVGGAIPDLSVIFNPELTSGVILGGTSIVGEEQEETVSGGILVGGIALESEEQEETTSGGILVGGVIADLSAIFNPELTSGVILGGTSIVGEEQEETVSGGILVGGAIPDLSAIFNPAIVGGALVGGIALESEEQEETTSGGILVGGVITDLSAIFDTAIVGGILVSGATTVNAVYAMSIDSGVIIGGAATVATSGIASEVGEGGILVGGVITDLSAIFNPAIVSGILVSGTALESEEQEETTSGGILVGGLVDVNSAEDFVVAGGILAGGSADSFVENYVRGGVLTGGVVNVSQGDFSPSGGILAGGSGQLGRVYTIDNPPFPIIIPSRGPSPTVKPHTQLNKNSLQFNGLNHAWPMLHPGGHDLYDLARNKNGYINAFVDVDEMWVVDGERGYYVVELSGNLDYIGFDDIQQSDDTTLSLWFNATAAASDERIIGQTSGLSGQSGPLRFEGVNSAIQHWNGNDWEVIIPANTVVAGEWHHLAVVWEDNGDVTGYLDGIQYSTGTGTFDYDGPTFGIGSPFLFSDGGRDGGDYFEGRFDDIRIYGRTLTSSEVHHLYAPQTRWELYQETEQQIAITAFDALGGLLCGATSDFNVAFNPSISSGSLLGGAAEVTAVYNVSVDSGVILGGESIVQEIQEEQVAGGATTGGVADISAIYNISLGGGVILGGEAIAQEIQEEQVSGGAILGGQAEATVSVSVGGGILVGGESTISITEDASGGVVIGGGLVTAEFDEVGESGAIVSGTADVSRVQIVILDAGGAVLGGISDVAIEFVVAGGAVLGGEAISQEIQEEEVSGGAITGGVAEASMTYTEVGFGGGVLSGIGHPAYGEIGSGGAIVSGEDIDETVTHAFTYTGDGIVIVGGNVGTRVFVRTPQILKPYVIELTTGDDCIDCCQSSRRDCPHWSEHWQDKWEGPFDAIDESVDEAEEVKGSWEGQWQDKWLPEYLGWLAPHPAGSQHPDSNHGPERVLSELNEET